MWRVLSFAAAVSVWIVGTPVFGQQTTIQLPTFHVTGVSTTVSVPDRGSMLLGGINRSSSGSVTSGVPGLSHVPGLNRLFKNRAIGSSTSAATISVNAFIHDLPEMDAALLAEAAAHRGGIAAPAGQLTAADHRAAYLSRNVGRAAEERGVWVSSSTPPPKVASIEEIRSEQALAKERQNEEAQSYLAQGLEAEELNQLGAAKVFYNMAARRATGDLKANVLARLQGLSPTSKGTKLAAENR